MKRVILFACVVLITPMILRAQEKTQEFSLQKAIEYAVEHNKQLEVSRKGIDLSKQKVRESIAQGLPQVDGSIDYSTNFGSSMTLDMGGGEMKMKMKDQMNGKISASQLIFSGQWILGIQTAKIAQQIAAENADVTELDIKENLYNTYYMILVYERLREIIGKNVENMEDLHTHTQNMYNAGTVEVTDVGQIRINVGKLKNSLSSIERNIKVSYNLFRIQLGLDANTTVVLTERLEDFLNQDAIMALQVNSFDMENNAQYKLMQSQEGLKKKMVGLQKWTYAPTIGATYSYTYKILKPDFDMSPKHAAGVVMSIPIFSGFQRKAKLEQTKIELEQTSLNRALLEDQLSSNDEQYKFELKNAMENYMLQRDNIEVARQVLENMQRKYEQGAVSSMDLTQANTNYLQAETDYANASMTLLQAKTQLEKLYNIFLY